MIDRNKMWLNGIMGVVVGDALGLPVQFKWREELEKKPLTDSLNGIVSAITEAMGQTRGLSGDIIIPIYLGGTMLDEVVMNAQQRTNLRSGGR